MPVSSGDGCYLLCIFYPQMAIYPVSGDLSMIDAEQSHASHSTRYRGAYLVLMSNLEVEQGVKSPQSCMHPDVHTILLLVADIMVWSKCLRVMVLIYV